MGKYTILAVVIAAILGWIGGDAYGLAALFITVPISTTLVVIGAIADENSEYK